MKGRLGLLVGVALAVLVLDQATKLWAVDRLTKAHEAYGLTGVAGTLQGYFTLKNLEAMRERPVVVHRDFWSFKYVENPGAAWGILGRASDAVRIPFFHVVSLAAITFIVLFYRRLDERQRLLQLALSLVLGGALGNFFDRIVRGYVIDFVDWHWKNDPGLHWPTFNVADVGISVGVALMLGETLLVRRDPPARQAAPAAPPEHAPDLATALRQATLPAVNPAGGSGGSSQEG